MRPRYMYSALPRTCCLLVLLAALVVTGCDEQTLGPQTQGRIEGTVLDAKTNEPIARANVTTSPPTQSVLTNADGTFEIENVPTGDYSIEVTKSDYESRSVQVKVQEDQTTNATILLRRKENFGSSDSLTARVTNWYNSRINRDSTGADSIFANVEYSVRNVGDVQINTYEVYFEIETSAGSFSHEATGDTLDVNQRDVREFRKFITAEAQAVRVEDLYWNASSN